MKNNGDIVKVDGPYKLGDTPCPGLLFPDPDYTHDLALMKWKGSLPDNMTIEEISEILRDIIRTN